MLKNFRLLLLLLPICLVQTVASGQDFFTSLIDGAKKKVEKMGAKTAEKLIKQTTNDLETDPENFQVLSVLNKVGKTLQADASNLIQASLIDEGLKKEYPNFYKAYSDLRDNDEVVKEIVFGLAEKHKSICHTERKTGTIFFDLYFFANKKISEDRAIFDLYQMSGYLHRKYSSENLSSAEKKMETQLFAYEYALQNTQLHASEYGCGPLLYAIGIVEKRNKETEDGSKSRAAKLVVTRPIYLVAKAFVAKKCK